MNVNMHNRSCTPPRFSCRVSPDLAHSRWSREGSGVAAAGAAVPIERRLGLDDDNISRSSCEPWGLSSAVERPSEAGRESTLKVSYPHPPPCPLSPPRLCNDSQSYICHVPVVYGGAHASRRTSLRRSGAHSPGVSLGPVTANPHLANDGGLAGLQSNGVGKSDTEGHAEVHDNRNFANRLAENPFGGGYERVKTVDVSGMACAPHSPTAGIVRALESHVDLPHFVPHNTFNKSCMVSTDDEEQGHRGPYMVCTSSSEACEVGKLRPLVAGHRCTQTEGVPTDTDTDVQHKLMLDKTNVDSVCQQSSASHSDGGCAAYAYAHSLWPPLTMHTSYPAPPTGARIYQDSACVMGAAVGLSAAATPPAHEHMLCLHGANSCGCGGSTTSPQMTSLRTCFETPVALRHSGGQPFSASSLMCTPQVPPFKVTLRNQLDAELNGVNKENRGAGSPDITMLIKNQLFMGGFPEPETLDLLQSYGVRHIISCCASEQCLSASVTNKFAVYNLFARDEHDYLILHNHYDEFEQFMRNASGRNEAVFVHCIAGVNRSVVLCAAYMVDHYKITPVEAVRQFRRCGRMRILENVGFRHQLVDHFLQYTGSQSTQFTYTGSKRGHA